MSIIPLLSSIARRSPALAPLQPLARTNSRQLRPLRPLAALHVLVYRRDYSIARKKKTRRILKPPRQSFTQQQVS